MPALAIVYGAHIGKSLLADSLAMCVGQVAPGNLGRILGRFRASLADGPIVFGDEGLPSIQGGRPATEEFRALVTSPVHLIELKGLDRSMEVRGGARVLLAANRPDRLFSNAGQLSAHDVDAITRRLLVIEVEDEKRIADCARMSKALGAVEGDPRRRLRVAQHLRWIQITRECAQPTPFAGSLGTALRRGSDIAGAAITAIEDGAESKAPWLSVSTPQATDVARAWINLEGLAVRLEGKYTGGVLARVLGPYLKGKPQRMRRNPGTGATLARRECWTEINLTACARDGIEIMPSDKTDTTT